MLDTRSGLAKHTSIINGVLIQPLHVADLFIFLILHLVQPYQVEFNVLFNYVGPSFMSLGIKSDCGSGIIVFGTKISFIVYCGMTYFPLNFFNQIVSKRKRMDVNTTWWTTNEVDNGDQYLGGLNSVVFYGHSGPNHALTVWDNGLACTQRGRGTLSQCYQASIAQLQTVVSWRIHNSSETVFNC